MSTTTYLRLRQKLGEEMSARPGWEIHPEQDYHYRHLATGVHLMIYISELTVGFGKVAGERYDKTVSASTKYLPAIALASALEVADALVVARTAAARAAETAEPGAG